MVSISHKQKTPLLKLFLKTISWITVLAILLVAIYTFSKYLMQDKFEKLITSEKAFHILVSGIDKNNEADLIFSIRLKPDSNQIGLMFLHPDAKPMEDSETEKSYVGLTELGKLFTQACIVDKSKS